MKILFAEDDRKVGKHVKDALTAEGYAVDWVDDGHEALWLAENYHFDLIVQNQLAAHAGFSASAASITPLHAIATGGKVA